MGELFGYIKRIEKNESLEDNLIEEKFSFFVTMRVSKFGKRYGVLSF